MMPLIQAGQIPNCLAAGNRTDSCKTLHTAKQWFFGLLLKELMDGAITISSLTALSHPLRHASLMSSWGTHYCSLVTWTTWSKCASFSSRRSEISVTIFQQRLQYISSTPSFYRDWTTVTASSWASLTASWVSCHRLWTLLLGWYLESGGRTTQVTSLFRDKLHSLRIRKCIILERCWLTIHALQYLSCLEYLSTLVRRPTMMDRCLQLHSSKRSLYVPLHLRPQN